MSVILTGMDMPRICTECPYFDVDNEYKEDLESICVLLNGEKNRWF